MRGSLGLSGRRARRTKSSRPEAGPKGGNLKVGAWRGPRLLVFDIVRHVEEEMCSRPCNVFRLAFAATHMCIKHMPDYSCLKTIVTELRMCEN